MINLVSILKPAWHFYNSLMIIVVLLKKQNLFCDLKLFRQIENRKRKKNQIDFLSRVQHKGSNKPHKKAYPTFPFLILQEQWDMFAFIASEFEQDNRPGEVRLGSAVSTGRDGWCRFGGGEVEGRWWHVSLTGRRAGKCVKGTLLTFLPGRFTPYIHDVSLIWPETLNFCLKILSSVADH